MTRAAVKETTKDVVIPGTIAAGLVALLAQTLGLLPQKAPSSEAEWKAAFVSWDKNYREDQRQNQARIDKLTDVLIELKTSISRMEGKLEK